MKKFFSLVVVAIMMGTSKSFAQGSLLATLSHEGNISAFYGVNALKTAVEAAAAGDVITLSSGQFNAVDITKPITLRGAGMSLSSDSLNAHDPTLILNSFNINITDTLSGRIIMEGLYFKNTITYSGHIKNAQFLKCRFSGFFASSGAKMTNTSFIHCRIRNGFYMLGNSNAYFINSLVGSPRSVVSSSNISFENCFVKFDYANDNDKYGDLPDDVVNAYYKNTIIQCTYNENALPSSCTAYNCVGMGNSYLFDKMVNPTNKLVAISSVFKKYAITAKDTYIEDTYNFELTESAAETYLGTDGTQVGIYGGNLAYDENPTIPQITKCNVAAKSTADGKLSVDIEVKAAEY